MTPARSWRSPLNPECVMQMEVTRWQENEQQQYEDQLTVEEPFEIRINGQNLAVIMRTPGHDHELAMGFLFTEGIIHHASDVVSIETSLDADSLPLPNVVNVILQENGRQETAFQPKRPFTVSASCGLCGKNSIADLVQETPPLESDNLHIPPTVLYELTAQLRTQQTIFSHTGGLHAAGLFSTTGELYLLREDVGRHNAVDKLIGHGLLHSTYPYRERILLVSGRASFEIIQKALHARIPCVAAISAPSNLAVELADKGGVTLIGFLRGHAMNVYTHPERII